MNNNTTNATIIRNSLSYLMDDVSDYTDTVHRNNFMTQDMRAYWYDIKNSGKYDYEVYDTDKFEDDLFRSYCGWMKEKYTTKFDNMTDKQIIDEYGWIGASYFLVGWGEVIDPENDIVDWWSDVKDEFDANDYLIKE